MHNFTMYCDLLIELCMANKVPNSKFELVLELTGELSEFREISHTHFRRPRNSIVQTY